MPRGSGRHFITLTRRVTGETIAEWSRAKDPPHCRPARPLACGFANGSASDAKTPASPRLADRIRARVSPTNIRSARLSAQAPPPQVRPVYSARRTSHMTRRIIPLALAVCGSLLSARVAAGADPLPRLKVSENKRFLVTEKGDPFFYLGDTAWELFHRLNRADTETYLDDRAAKGFNVIQAVVLAEFDGLTEPNADGALPLENNDPTKPVEKYFQHVDWAVDQMAKRGMYCAMLPTWGDKVNKKWGKGPEIFTPENARVFGEFLGKRYKDKPIIWMLGGDRPIEKPVHTEIWRAMAAGIEAG